MHQPAASRRHFLTASAATAVAAVAGFPTIAAAQSPVSFRFQGAWSPKDIFHEYALDYARKVMDMSGGRMRIDVLPAGAVVKPQDMLDAVHRGALDGCHAVPALWSRKNSAFSLFGSGPAFGMDANNFLSWMKYGDGTGFYGELYGQILNLDVVGFLYGPMPCQPLGWFKRPIATADQFKDLKFRTDGLAADLYRRMGAAVNELPGEEIVSAMDRGLLDAAEFNNATSDRQLGLPGASRSCMLHSYHQPAETFEILFNRKKFNLLSPDLKAIARHAAEAASADMSWKALHRYSSDYAEMREKQGVIFHRTPASVLRAQMRAWSAVAARKALDDQFFEKVLKSQTAWARRTVRWALDTVVDPRIAYDHWFGSKPSAGRPAR